VIAEIAGDSRARAAGIGQDSAVRDTVLEVRLGTEPRSAPITELELAELTLAKDKDHGLSRGRTVAMQRQPDGTFVAELDAPGDDLVYELGIGASGHTTNGTEGDRFTFDGDDYASHAAVVGGKATIHFDPRLLPPPGRPAQITFAHPGPVQTEIARIERELAAQHAAEAAAESGTHAPPLDLTALRAELDRKLAAELDPALRRTLLVGFFLHPRTEGPDNARIGDLVATRTIAEVPADSELWKLWPDALVACAESAEPAVQTYAERAASLPGDRGQAASVLVELGFAAQKAQRTADVQRITDELKLHYAGVPQARLATAFDPNRKIRVGQPIPAFDLASLDNPSAHITRDALRGKFVLLDFWATWCHPCVGEMPNLDAAYRAFRARGLAIVSVDTWDKPEAASAFRKAKWPMPWQHAPCNAGTEDALEILVLPTAMLVDPHGTIVAVGAELRGAELARTLERLLPRG
jgi:thiol-disulfide isomerase/thioredoxin